METFSIKKLINGVVIVPDDIREWSKWIVAVIVAVLTSVYGKEVTGEEIVIVTGIVKAILDTIHYYIVKE